MVVSLAPCPQDDEVDPQQVRERLTHPPDYSKGSYETAIPHEGSSQQPQPLQQQQRKQQPSQQQQRN
jgi:hypothetical protein